MEDCAALRASVIRFRNAIRHHRDQFGDDRCWIDDHLLYHVVLGEPDLKELPSRDEMLRRCRIFHECRRGPARPIHTPVVADCHDAELEYQSYDELRVEEMSLYQEVRAHLEKGEEKTFEDDRALYLVLPERDPGDLRHPDGLLENCGRFYEAKEREVRSGGPLKIHQW